jgi:formylglycine-generating enzyme required for sulfatase activity
MNVPAINTNKIEYDKVNIYPDTLCWYRPNNTYNYTFDLEHLRHIYFMHRFFNNYPVVGVNWYQAMAYCKWKTMRLKEEALKKKKTINAVFRLPTQAEWQYASTVRKHKIGAITYEVEDDSFFSLWDKKGKLRYNIVSIIDKNGSSIYTNTQNKYTASVKSFPCNYYKLYHLRGNVSEWMLDKPSESQFLFYNYTRLQGDTLAYSEQITKQLNQLTDKTKKIELLTTLLNDINRKLKNHFVDEESEQLNYQLNVLSDLRIKLIFSNSDLRIIKGGSWEDGVIYQQAVACELINSNTKRRSTGFRITLSVSQE